MEHPEEITSNETATIAELKRNDGDVASEQEGGHSLESHNLRSSTIIVCPERSTHVNSNTSLGDALDRNVASLANSEHPARNPNLFNDDAGLIVEELTMRNFMTPNSGVSSRSVTREGFHQRQQSQWKYWYQLAGDPGNRGLNGDLMSRDGGAISLISRENLPRMSVDVDQSNSFSRKQLSSDSGEAFAHLKDGYRRIIGSNSELIGTYQSNIVSSSTFSAFFNKQLPKGKGIEVRGPDAHAGTGTTKIAENEKACFKSKASSFLSNVRATYNQHSSYDIDKSGEKPLNDEINLREWLQSRGSDINKVQRLHLFRQIVQLVDIAHSQGIALQDLLPSHFTVSSSNIVKYTGLSTKMEISEGDMHISRKRELDVDMYAEGELRVKQQKLGRTFSRSCSGPISKYKVSNEAVNEISTTSIPLQLCNHTRCKTQNCRDSDGTSLWTQSQSQQGCKYVQLEKKWYYLDELNDGGLLSSNIYSLGVLLFELLCHFESDGMHSDALLDLQERILPPTFLSENPKEAGFCLWLLHPEPSSRPTTREILQSELMCGLKDLCMENYAYNSEEEDAKTELLAYFLFSLKEQKENRASKLLASIECLEEDIKEVERRYISRTSSKWMHKGLSEARQGIRPKDHIFSEGHLKSLPLKDLLEGNLKNNISQLEEFYFTMRYKVQHAETATTERSDIGLLRNRDRWLPIQNESGNPSMEGKPVDRVGAFFEGICKFACYNKFEVCGTLRNNDLLNSTNVVCSLGFDRDEEYIAAAGVSKKIKIFEFSSLFDDAVDIQYPVVEMSNKSKLSCVCWNKYIKNYLASTDYDGIVQMWDAGSGQGTAQYTEHQKRAWSVDFSPLDPTKFASGSDDCSVKLWSINERNSFGTIANPANVCCVQFSAFSSHLLAFGSADYKIYCYDLRNARIPWCTLAGHGKAVSYVKFLDSETIVSASTDNTLKLWDLKRSSLEGLSSDACSLTFSGHTNQKNFVGLTHLDGYITCGSETNEVFAYYRSLPMPIMSYKFGSIDPISGQEISDSNGQFVSSVCWRSKSSMVVAANSSGAIKLLRMV